MLGRRQRLPRGLTGLPREILAIASRLVAVYMSCKLTGGPGYRVYYAMIGKAVVLLLCSGDKRKQSADIERALKYLKDYKERSTIQ